MSSNRTRNGHDSSSVAFETIDGGRERRRSDIFLDRSDANPTRTWVTLWRECTHASENRSRPIIYAARQHVPTAGAQVARRCAARGRRGVRAGGNLSSILLGRWIARRIGRRCWQACWCWCSLPRWRTSLTATGAVAPLTPRRRRKIDGHGHFDGYHVTIDD